MDLNIEAAARAAAFEFGILTLRSLSNWADEIIAAEDDFDPRLLDVSLSDSKGPAITALNLIGSDADKQRTAIRIMQIIKDWLLTQDGDFLVAAKALSNMAQKDLEPGTEIDGSMYAFWEDLDLALYGSHGDPDAIKAEMMDFLSEAASLELTP